MEAEPRCPWWLTPWWGCDMGALHSAVGAQVPVIADGRYSYCDYSPRGRDIIVSSSWCVDMLLHFWIHLWIVVKYKSGMDHFKTLFIFIMIIINDAYIGKSFKFYIFFFFFNSLIHKVTHQVINIIWYSISILGICPVQIRGLAYF